MKRRVFVGSALAGTGLAMRRSAHAAVKPGDIPTRAFGKTGVKLTVIGLAGGRFPLCTREEAREITHRAYELGITYFDTARSYWNGASEEVYGEVLPPWRKNIFITTKSTERTRHAAEAELTQSLKALRTDYIDLWHVHAVSEMKEVDQIFGPGGAFEAYEAAKKSGKVRFIGFTGHTDPHVHFEMLQRYHDWDGILMPLHAADPGYLSFEKIVLPTCVERKMGVQAMKPLANAKLLQTLSVRECLNYTLSLPITCAAMGCTTIGQIEDDVRVARTLKQLSGEEMAGLRERVNGIKGPGLEDWKRNVLTAGLDPRPKYLGS
jgi:uncharacterized protein